MRFIKLINWILVSFWFYIFVFVVNVHFGGDLFPFDYETFSTNNYYINLMYLLTLKFFLFNTFYDFFIINVLQTVNEIVVLNITVVYIYVYVFYDNDHHSFFFSLNKLI